MRQETTCKEQAEIVIAWYEIATIYNIEMIFKALSSLWIEVAFPNKSPLSEKLEVLQLFIHYFFKRDLDKVDLHTTEFAQTNQTSPFRSIVFLCFLLYRAAWLTFNKKREFTSDQRRVR